MSIVLSWDTHTRIYFSTEWGFNNAHLTEVFYFVMCWCFFIFLFFQKWLWGSLHKAVVPSRQNKGAKARLHPVLLLCNVISCLDRNTKSKQVFGNVLSHQGCHLMQTVKVTCKMYLWIYSKSNLKFVFIYQSTFLVQKIRW